MTCTEAFSAGAALGLRAHQQSSDGISSSLLRQRPNELVDAGLVEQLPDARYALRGGEVEAGTRPTVGSSRTPAGTSFSISSRGVAGAQPSARRVRPLTTVSHRCSWPLKSPGPVKLRPGRNERSR